MNRTTRKVCKPLGQADINECNIKKNQFLSGFSGSRTTRLVISMTLMVIFCFSPLYGQNTQRNPIDVNLIVDSSAAFAGLRDEISAWVSSRLDQVLAEGDRITVWSAGSEAAIIFEGKINSNTDKENAKKSIREISASGENADFSGALREAAGRQGSGFSYTLLICTDPASLSSVITGPQSNLLRFSRVEEVSTWRALVVGLNLDTRTRRAASAFFGS